MKINWKLLTLVLSITAGAFIAGGCSSNSSDNGITPEGNEEQTVNLDDTYGGFLSVPEDPAFGDVDLALSESEEISLEDGYEGLCDSDRSEAEAAEEISSTRAWYSFSVRWGRLDRKDATSIEEDPITEDIEWNGDLSLSDGVIRLLSRISFEINDGDHVVKPRPGPGELSWESSTHGSFDGIRIYAIVPIEGSGENEATLTFNSSQLGPISFSRSELEDLEQTIDVGSDGLQVSFRAFRADPHSDLRGYCGGEWGWSEADSVGRFQGRWVEITGRTVGFMRGHYGLNKNDEPVFFGKYIDRDGAFRGFLKGNYSTLTSGDVSEINALEVGEFRGHWIDSRGNALGRLSGTWLHRDGKPGRFDGRWAGSSISP